MCFEKDEGRGTGEEVDTERHEKRRGEGRKKGRIGKEGMKKDRKEGGMKGVGRKDEKGEGRHNLRWGREDRSCSNEWITLLITQITENLINLFF